MDVPFTPAAYHSLPMRLFSHLVYLPIVAPKQGTPSMKDKPQNFPSAPPPSTSSRPPLCECSFTTTTLAPPGHVERRLHIQPCHESRSVPEEPWHPVVPTILLPFPVPLQCIRQKKKTCICSQLTPLSAPSAVLSTQSAPSPRAIIPQEPMCTTRQEHSSKRARGIRASLFLT